MEWMDDEVAMQKLDDLMKSLNDSLIPFLDILHTFECENPNYFLLFMTGKLVIFYDRAKNNGCDHKDALIESLTAVAEDAHTQQFISQFVGDKIHEGLTGYE